jgi:hypothetical protein
MMSEAMHGKYFMLLFFRCKTSVQSEYAITKTCNAEDGRSQGIKRQSFDQVFIQQKKQTGCEP